jgi:LacI family transcriptional regulator
MGITIKDIAKKLNVSISTVSRALNGNYGVHPKTIAVVREAAKSMGYVPNLGAKQLVGKRSNLVGIFMPEFEFEANPDFVDFFPPMHKALRLFGKDVLIISVSYSTYIQNSLTEWIGMRNLEGCVFMPMFSKEHPIIQEALKLQIPCVNSGGAVGSHCSNVSSDDREGGRIGGAMLLEKGHRTIAYIDGPEHLHICEERYAGFCSAYLDIGLKHDSTHAAAGDFSGASGALLAVELWRRVPELTAIFCANDLMAMGAIMALTANGVKVPEQVSIAGYDGAFFTAYTTPPLTTIRHSSERIGVLIAEMLVELLNGGIGRRESISPILIERKSVVGH